MHVALGLTEIELQSLSDLLKLQVFCFMSWCDCMIEAEDVLLSSVLGIEVSRVVMTLGA